MGEENSNTLSSVRHLPNHAGRAALENIDLNPERMLADRGRSK
jgi:hypothetical protein